MLLHQELSKKASSYFMTADHLAYVTFPVVNDLKLIPAILENLNLALLNAMNAALEYERYYKRLQPLPENFDSRYSVFEDKLINKYNILKKEAQLIHQVNNVMKNYKDAPIEFPRKDKFVIFNHEYRMKTVSMPEIKDFLIQARELITKITKVVNR